MKSIFKVGFVAIAVALSANLTSCSSGDQVHVLTASDVEDEVERIQPSFKHVQVEELNVGYYEVDATMLHKLDALKQEGLITLSAENVIEVKRRYWGGTYEVSHVFVNVALTEAGNAFVVSDEEVERWREEDEVVDADMQTPEDALVYEAGEYDISTIRVVRDQPLEAAEDTPTASVPSSNDRNYNSNSVAPPAGVPTPEPTVYEQAVARVNSTVVYVKAYNIEIFKVRNIKCTPKMLEEGKAKAQVILTSTNVTPFGRILDGAIEGRKAVRHLTFELYTDGWRIEED